VTIDVDATREPFEAVAGGSVDLALVSSDGKDRRVDLRPLFKDEMVVLVSAEHPFAAQRFVRPRQLSGETLLTYMALEDSTAYRRLLRPLGLRPKHHLQVRLTEAMVELVRNGMGVSVAARWSVAPHLAAGAVRGVPIGRRGLWRQWQAATLRSANVPRYVGDFVDMLAKEAPENRNVTAYPSRAPKRRAG
jgi:LysR family transcriptional regulator for metE and metH